MRPYIESEGEREREKGDDAAELTAHIFIQIPHSLSFSLPFRFLLHIQIKFHLPNFNILGSTNIASF